jgi:hypothetical protein
MGDWKDKQFKSFREHEIASESIPIQHINIIVALFRNKNIYRYIKLMCQWSICNRLKFNLTLMSVLIVHVYI